MDEIAIIGSAAECRDLMRGYIAGGIHTNIVSCMVPSAEVLKATVEAFSAENFETP